MSRRAVLIVALALSSRAHAFAPTTDVYVGVEPNRVYHTDWHEQLRLADLPQWRKFIGGEGSGWQARFDERTGDPHRMWGPGIDVGADPAKGVMELVLRHPELTGLDPSALRLARVGTVDRIGRTWVDIDVMFDGAPIWRGGITARLEGTKVVMLGVDAYAHTPRVGSAVVSDTAAIAASIAQGAAPSATHTAESASLVWLPEEIAGEVRLRLCWLVRSETQVPRGNWVSFVDASSGELVAEYNEVRFANGTVTGEHEIRTVGDEVITSPLPLAHVIDGTESVYADVDGHFETVDIGVHRLGAARSRGRAAAVITSSPTVGISCSPVTVPFKPHLVARARPTTRRRTTPKDATGDLGFRADEPGAAEADLAGNLLRQARRRRALGRVRCRRRWPCAESTRQSLRYR